MSAPDLRPALRNLAEKIRAGMLTDAVGGEIEQLAETADVESPENRHKRLLGEARAFLRDGRGSAECHPKASDVLAVAEFLRDGRSPW